MDTKNQTEQYIRAKQDQLKEWEHAMEDRAHAAGDKLSEQVATWKSKRDEIVTKLGALKHDTSDRWDIVRMGFESAWDELKAAYETATSKDSRPS